MKILKRQKKLVDRLRAGGASTKQIYAILGISNKAKNSIIEDGESRKMGIKENADNQRSIYITGNTSQVPQVRHKSNFLPPIHMNPKQMRHATERPMMTIMKRETQELPSLPYNYGMKQSDQKRQKHVSQYEKHFPKGWQSTVLPPIAPQNMSSSMTKQLTTLHFIKARSINH